ncbi:MAG: T9SS type B sorting domain-containing protein [Psychroflexus maritimus]
MFTLIVQNSFKTSFLGFLFSFSLFPVFSVFAQDCPTVEAIMVDACGTEQLNEFVIVDSGGGFDVDDFQFTFNPTNTGGSTNKNVNIGFDSCGLTNGDESLYTGCTNIFSAGPGDSIPPNSYVVFQTSNNADANYDFSSLCADDKCIYVIANACERTIGAFTNKSGTGIRQNFLSIAGTECVDEASYFREDLISNSDGNYFLPPNTYGVDLPDRCTSPPVPDLPPVSPSFNFETSLCTSETNDFDFPNASIEGILGTWSPAFDETQNQTYTFTPNPGECGQEVSIEIIIFQEEIPAFSFSTTRCEDETSELPSTSDNGIAGEWNPALVDGTTTSYAFTPFEEECAEIIEIEIDYLPIEEPIFTIEESICEGENIELASVSDNGIPGQWSPEFDNQNSGSYVFTPDNQCFPEFSINIDVQESIVFEFDLDNEVCASDADEFELPNSSINGFSGTWTPDFNPEISTTYTFIPEGVNCFEVFSLPVEIISAETPVFNLPELVCQGDFVELPSESENGIQGSWNTDFDVNNSAIYSFTPDEEECANEVNVNIEIIETIVPNFNLPDEVCENQDFELPTLSENEISGTWSPAFGQAENEVYTFTPLEEFCATTTSVNIQLIPDVTPEFDLPEQICVGDSLLLPTNSINGIAGEWSPVFNPNETETYTFTPTSETCLIDSIERTIEVVNFELNFEDLSTTKCSDEVLDLMAEFDLTNLANQINFQDLDYLMSFHVSENEAIENLSALPDVFVATESNQNVFLRVEDENSGCFIIEPIELEVEFIPGPFPEELYLEDCVISQDNFSQFFDLTSVESELNEGVSQLSSFEIDYYTSEIGAIEADSNQLISNPSNYLSQTSTENLDDQVFIRITNTASEQECFELVLLDLSVATVPEIEFDTLLAVCRDEANESDLASFDLTSIFIENIDDTNAEAKFFLNEEDLEAGNAIENPTNFQNTTNPQSLFIQLNNQGSSCSIETNISLVVVPNPTLPELEPMIACEGVEEGISNFDLLQQAETIIANETDVELSFHETETEALLNENPILIQDDNGQSILYQNQNPFAQTLFVRLSAIEGANQFETDCFSVEALDLLVEPNPVINQVNNLNLCDDAIANASTAFDLTLNEQFILGSQNETNFKISYHLTAQDAQSGVQKIAVPQNYTNTQNPQEIFIRIESLTSDCFVANESFFVQVDERPDIALTAEFEYVCAEMNTNQAANNEQAIFDLTTKNEEISPAFEDENIEVRYYTSEANLEAGSSIENPSEFQNTENPQLIFAEVVNTANQCTSLTSVEFELHVHPLPLVDLSNMDGKSICVDPITNEVIDPLNLPVLDTGLDSSRYAFTWFLNGELLPQETNPSIVAIVEGLYEVEVTDVGFSLNTACYASSQALLIESSAPVFEIKPLGQAFEDNQQIEVFNIQGSGDFEFSVDGSDWIALNNQTNLVFEAPGFGEIQVVGRDRNGCGEFIQQLSLIDYPKFFTPNNDGFNDTWNINGLEGQNSKIYIFDRYGKLLKQIKPNNYGWDGTYNGKPMPSNDYWFKVEYNDPRTGVRKTFKSNFTLKR